MREAFEDLGDALDHEIDPAAVIAREPPQDQRQREGERDADDADGERDARGIDDAAQHVAAEPVGSQQEEGAALGRTDEMKRAFDQAPELVRLATAEKAQLLPFG